LEVLDVKHKTLKDNNMMNIHCKFLNKANLSLSPEKAEKLVRKDCNNFLKTRKGLSYLCMKYPNLSVSEAVNKYINNALWIDSIV
jgi:hypothetical protein